METKLFQNVLRGTYHLLHVSVCRAAPLASGNSASAVILDRSSLSINFQCVFRAFLSDRSVRRAKDKEENHRKRHELEES